VERFFSDFAQAIRLVASHRLFGAAVTLIGASLCLVFWFWPPAPGAAVVCLAVGAAVMAIQNIKTLGKTLWVAFVVVMGLVEVRAIYTDRAKQTLEHTREIKAQEATHVADQRALNDQFQEILRANGVSTQSIITDANQQFTATESRFASLIDEDDIVRKLSEKNLKSVTNALDAIRGTNSYLYLRPISLRNRGFRLAAVNVGPNPLTGVTVSMIRVVDVAAAEQFRFSDEPGIVERDINIGTVSGYGVRVGAIPLVPDIRASGMDVYLIYINTQNGNTRELLYIRKGPLPGTWQHKFKVWRLEPNGTPPENTDIHLVPLLSKDAWEDESEYY
jgi:hypothetical protein